MWQVIAIIGEDCHAEKIAESLKKKLINGGQEFIPGFNHSIGKVVLTGLDAQLANVQVTEAIHKVIPVSNTSSSHSTWNSTFEMLLAALEERDSDLISNEDWDGIAELIKVWSLFHIATDKASTSKSFSYMEVLSSLNSIEIYLTRWEVMYASTDRTLSGGLLSRGQRSSFSFMCGAMLEELRNYMGNLSRSKILSIAALLHPYTKQELIKSSFLPEVRKFLQSYLDKASPSTEVSLLGKSESMFDMEFVRTKGKQPSAQSATDELEVYLRTPRCESKDALAWWKETGEDSYPKLAKIAKDFLCINFSSATSKHLFSPRCGQEEQRRWHLESKNIDESLMMNFRLHLDDERPSLKELYKRCCTIQRPKYPNTSESVSSGGRGLSPNKMPARRSSASKDLAWPEDPGNADQYVEAPATNCGAGETWLDILNKGDNYSFGFQR